MLMSAATTPRWMFRVQTNEKEVPRGQAKMFGPVIVVHEPKKDMYKRLLEKKTQTPKILMGEGCNRTRVN